MTLKNKKASSTATIITDYERALLSTYVYYDDNVELPSDWTSILSYYYPKECFGLIIKASACSYYAEAFLKGDQIVIAHRGSQNPFQNLNNWWDNFLNLMNGQLTAYYPFAVDFTNQVAKYAQEYNYQINSHTGHSLGGHITELMSATFNVSGVSFESPGSLTVLTHNSKFGRVPLIQLKSLITTYNAAPNLINTMDAHPGTLHRVYPDYNFKAIISVFTFQQHKMVGILQQFDQNVGKLYIDGNGYNIWKDGSPVMGTNIDIVNRNINLNDAFYESYDVNPYFWEGQFKLYLGISDLPSSLRLVKIGCFLPWWIGWIDIAIGGNLGCITKSYSQPGMIINADNANKGIWGATNYADIINTGTNDNDIWTFTGNDVVTDLGGYDTYHFYLHNMQGKHLINDQDGQGAIYLENIFCNLRGSFQIYKPDPSQYIFKPKDQKGSFKCDIKTMSFRLGYNHKSDIFLLRLVNNDQDLQITYNSQNVKAFPYSTDNAIYLTNFAQGNFGIYLPNANELRDSVNETNVIGINGNETIACLQNDNSEVYGLIGYDQYVFYIGNDYNCTLMGNIFDPKVFKAQMSNISDSGTGIIEIVGFKYGDLLDLSILNLTDFSQIGYDVVNETTYFTLPNSQTIILDLAARDINMTLGNGTFSPAESNRVVVSDDENVILSLATEQVCDPMTNPCYTTLPTTCNEQPLSPGAWAGIGIAGTIVLELVGIVACCMCKGGGGGGGFIPLPG